MLYDKCFATSPLGNNSVEAGGTGNATPTGDNTPRGVPLVFDPITQQFVSKLSAINQDDREVALDIARKNNEDQSFLRAVGYT